MLVAGEAEAQDPRTGPPAGNRPGLISSLETGLALAGTVGLVYVIGGAVMWLRFRQAGLPADQAVALLPKTDLLVAGLRVMILPAVAAAAFLVVLACWQNARFDRLERQRGSMRDALDSLPPDAAERPKLERRLARLAEREHRLLPQPESRRRRVAIGVSAAVALVFALILPFSPGAFVWPIVLLAIVVYWQRLWTSSREGGETRPKPSLLRIAAVAVIASVLVSIARQVDPMTQLPSVAVYLSADEKSAERDGVVRGVLVTATNEIVAVGDPRTHSISTYPRAHVTALSVLPPLVPHTPPSSLISKLMFHDAWAWTPLRVWCEGDGYGWRRLGSVCKARPSVEPGSLRVVDGSVHGLRLRCPEEAVTACRGFVILRTAEPQYDPQTGARLPAQLSRKDFNVQAGESAELQLPFDKTWKATLPDANPSVRVMLARDTLGEQVMFDDEAEGLQRTLSITRAPKHETKPQQHKKKKTTKKTDNSAPGNGSTPPPPGRSDGEGAGNQEPADGDQTQDEPQGEATPAPEETPTPDPNPLVPPPSDDEITAPPAPAPTP
jgi:hypothetical protein